MKWSVSVAWEAIETLFKENNEVKVGMVPYIGPQSLSPKPPPNEQGIRGRDLHTSD